MDASGGMFSNSSAKEAQTEAAIDTF